MIVKDYRGKLGGTVMKPEHESVYEHYRLWMLHSGGCIMCRNSFPCSEGEELKFCFYEAEMNLRTLGKVIDELEYLTMPAVPKHRRKLLETLERA